MKYPQKLMAGLLVFVLASVAFAQPQEADQETAQRGLCQAVAERDADNFFLWEEYPFADVNFLCPAKRGSAQQFTPLQLAVLNDDSSLWMVKKLVKMGAKIDGFSLKQAIVNDNLEFVQFFLSKGADLCISLKNSPLGRPASKYAKSEEMKQLLQGAEAKANLEVKQLGLCSVKK